MRSRCRRRPKPADAIFLSDAAEGADLLEAAQIVQPLAQLCVTGQVQTPFLAAIAGPPGAGKTFALKLLAQMVENSAGSAGALARVVVARVDASDGAEPHGRACQRRLCGSRSRAGRRRLFGAVG